MLERDDRTEPIQDLHCSAFNGIEGRRADFPAVCFAQNNGGFQEAGQTRALLLLVENKFIWAVVDPQMAVFRSSDLTKRKPCSNS
jgi:hypothetical protein